VSRVLRAEDKVCVKERLEARARVHQGQRVRTTAEDMEKEGKGTRERWREREMGGESWSERLRETNGLWLYVRLCGSALVCVIVCL